MQDKLNIDKFFAFYLLMNTSSISSGGTKFKYKIIFLGDQSTGKTAIIDRYIRDQFEEKPNV